MGHHWSCTWRHGSNGSHRSHWSDGNMRCHGRWQTTLHRTWGRGHRHWDINHHRAHMEGEDSLLYRHLLVITPTLCWDQNTAAVLEHLRSCRLKSFKGANGGNAILVRLVLWLFVNSNAISGGQVADRQHGGKLDVRSKDHFLWQLLTQGHFRVSLGDTLIVQQHLTSTSTTKTYGLPGFQDEFGTTGWVLAMATHHHLAALFLLHHYCHHFSRRHPQRSHAASAQEVHN
mmetsp:Transcript_13693/g.30263  ORF Transcript_13693/g.30263 Transcript_13693/m.30263 type:complete len:230 (+) Transcript_13693:708-1397(+)